MRLYCERLRQFGVVYGLIVWIEPFDSEGSRISYYVRLDEHSGLTALRADEVAIVDDKISDMKVTTKDSPQRFFCMYWDRFDSFDDFTELLDGDLQREAIFEALIAE